MILDFPKINIKEISQAAAEEAMRAHIESQLRSSRNGEINIFRYAAFCILEQRGQVFLGARNTSPEAQSYSVIGGKLDFIEGRDIRNPAPEDLLVRGIETPSQAARRELIEEAFAKKSATLSLRSSGDGLVSDELEFWFPLSSFKRVSVVYDKRHNYYCFIYRVKVRDEIEASLSPRELSDLKPLSEIIKQDLPMNCLTNFVLCQLDLLPAAKPPSQSYLWGKVSHMACTSDAVRLLGMYPVGGEMSSLPSSCSKEIDGAGYFLDCT